MSNTKISVITPVYNSTKHLSQCIESMLAQTLLEWEMICVNDGSTDTSLEILRTFASGDERIKIINKKNEGQGVARNLALLEAKGDYVLYLDSDDWLEKNALELMYKKISSDNADLTLFNAYMYYEETKMKNEATYVDCYYLTFGEDVFSPAKAFEIILETNGLPFKIYNRSFLVENEINYLPHRFIEDSPFYIKAMLRAKKISCLDKPLYNYRKHSSNVSKQGAKHFHNIAEVFNVCEKILKETPNYELFIPGFIENRVRQILYYYWGFEEKDRKIHHETIRKIFKYISKTYGKDVLKNSTYDDVFKQMSIYPFSLYKLINCIKKTLLVLKTYRV